MSAVFEHQNPASPLAYSSAQTALLLLDFHGFVIDLCSGGQAAMTQAAQMRNWALARNMMVVHSVVDVTGIPPTQRLGRERMANMLAGIRENKEAVSEPSVLAYSAQPREHLVYKRPGVVSALKSDGCEKILADNNIKSLIICGLSTSGAVLWTSLPATDDGFVVSIIQDACADRTTELHDTLIKSVFTSKMNVATTAEFIGGWDRAEGVMQS